MAINLPEGFVLDQPNNSMNLPDGFVLDQPQSSSQQTPEAQDALLRQNFAKAHPIMTGAENVGHFMNDSLLKTLGLTGGKSLTDISQQTPIPTTMTGDKGKDFLSVLGLGAKGLGRDVAASVGDFYSSPTGILTLGLGPAINAISKPLQLSKELSMTAKAIGAPANTSESIVRTLGLQREKEILPLNEAISSEKTNFSNIEDSIKANLAKEKGLQTKKIYLTREAQNKSRDAIMSDLNSQLSSLKAGLNKDIGTAVRYLKDEIPINIQKMNDVFGNEIDRIGQVMADNGKGISHTDNFNILNQTNDEVNSLGISTGRAKALLDKLHQEASSSVEGHQIPTGLVDNYGNPVMHEFQGNGADLIPFKDFIQQSRAFKRILSESKLSGTKGMNDEDIVGAIYYKNLNKFMEENVNGYRSLQKEYAPVINAMKTARRIFQPGNIYSDTQGANLLKAYAQGTATPGKEQLLADIQASSKFSGGMGDMTSGLKSTGDKINDIEKKIAEYPKSLRYKFSNELKAIKDEHAGNISKLNAELEANKNSSELKIREIGDKIKEVTNQYDNKVNRVRDVSEQLGAIKSKHDAMLNIASKLGQVGVGVGVAAAGYKALTK